MKRTSFLAALAAASLAQALTPAEWRQRSIYQIVTDRFSQSDGSTTVSCTANAGQYCGGTWQGIKKQLDYIQGMGFDAIWISPIVKNVEGSGGEDGEAFHGYWAQDIYALNQHFGTEQDLKDLSSALKQKNMALMVDVVTNHMGYIGAEDAVQYNTYNPFSDVKYFHPPCKNNYSLSNVTNFQVCWEGDNTVALPDMRTEDTDVRTMWNDWIKGLVSNYSIDGLRIDSATEVEPEFFPGFQEAAGGIHVLGELFVESISYQCSYQKYMSGTLNYQNYFAITSAFKSSSGDMSGLASTVKQMNSTCKDVTLLGSFVENHDNPRFPSLTEDISLAKNAIAFTMLQDGIPIIYYGQEQHFNGDQAGDREALWLGQNGYSTTSVLYTWIKALNAIRKEAISLDSSYLTTNAYSIYTDTHTIAMRKGKTGNQVIGVFSNSGASASNYQVTLPSSQTGFSPSETVLEVLSCKNSTTDSSGNLDVSITNGLTQVFYPAAKLVGSNICDSGSSTTPSPTSSTSSGTTSNSPTQTTTSCSIPSSIAITFSETVTTTYGTTIKLVGSSAALGSWNPSSGIALSASGYTSSNPVWSGTVNMAPGTNVQYKFVKVASGGTVTWEGGSNRVLNVPNQCGEAGTLTVKDSWQS